MAWRMLTEIDWIEIDADLVAGETEVGMLAERYDLNIRTMQRRRAILRERGVNVRTAEPMEKGNRHSRKRA